MNSVAVAGSSLIIFRRICKIWEKRKPAGFFSEIEQYTKNLRNASSTGRVNRPCGNGMPHK